MLLGGNILSTTLALCSVYVLDCNSNNRVTITVHDISSSVVETLQKVSRYRDNREGNGDLS